MNVLDRAFIKAYAKGPTAEGAAHDPHGGAVPPPRRPARPTVHSPIAASWLTSLHVAGGLPVTDDEATPDSRPTGPPARPGQTEHMSAALVAAAVAAHQNVQAVNDALQETPVLTGPLPGDSVIPADTGTEGEIQLRMDATEPAQTTGPHFDAAESPSREDASLKPFRPQWEVDRFDWPSVADRLENGDRERFAGACESLKESARRGNRVVALIGCTVGAGCTTLSQCLARRLAEDGLAVALVDADFQNPQLAEQLAVSVETGWEETLTGKAAVEEVAVKSLEDRLTLLPLTNGGAAAGDASWSEHAAAALKRLSSRHDLVLLDVGTMTGGKEKGVRSHLCEAPEGPSRQMTPDSFFLGAIDAALVVRDLRQETPDQVSQTAAQLRRAGIEPLGVAETFANEP